MRFWGVLLVVASWWLALSVDIGVVDGSPALGLILTVLLSVGSAVAAVLLIPIETIWVRWVVNPLVMIVPALVLLELVSSWL